MAEQQFTDAWQVFPGVYIYDGDWKVWFVEDRRYNRQTQHWEFLLTDHENTRWVISLDPAHQVCVSIPYYSKAEALVAHYLKVDGVRRAVMRMEDLAFTKDTVAARREVAFHLFEHHAISISPTADKSNGSLEDLLACHNLAHADRRFAYVHVHVPLHEL